MTDLVSRGIKFALSGSIFFLLFFCAGAQACSGNDPPCPSGASIMPADFSIEAGALLVHMEAWRLKIGPDADAVIEGGLQGGPAMGDVRGSFLLHARQLEALLAHAEALGFFAMPEDIAPKKIMPMHMRTMWMRISTGGKRHFVRVFAGEHVEDRAIVDRFMALWNATFKLVPLRVEGSLFFNANGAAAR